MGVHTTMANHLSNSREYLNDDRKHPFDKVSRKLTGGTDCVDDDGHDPDCEEVFLPNSENTERKTKTRQHSLHHSDSRSSGIFSQVII